MVALTTLMPNCETSKYGREWELKLQYSPTLSCKVVFLTIVTKCHCISCLVKLYCKLYKRITVIWSSNMIHDDGLLWGSLLTLNNYITCHWRCVTPKYRKLIPSAIHHEVDLNLRRAFLNERMKSCSSEDQYPTGIYLFMSTIIETSEKCVKSAQS